MNIKRLGTESWVRFALTSGTRLQKEKKEKKTPYFLRRPAWDLIFSLCEHAGGLRGSFFAIPLIPCYNETSARLFQILSCSPPTASVREAAAARRGRTAGGPRSLGRGGSARWWGAGPSDAAEGGSICRGACPGCSGPRKKTARLEISVKWLIIGMKIDDSNKNCWIGDWHTVKLVPRSVLFY